MDDSEDLEPSLDQLSQAFAAAMGRVSPTKQVDVNGDSDPCDSVSSAEPQTRDASVEACPLSPKSIFESILFVGHPDNEPIQAERVAGLLRGVPPEEIEELVQELNNDYQLQAMPFTIQVVGDGYLLELRPEYEHLRERFYGNVREAKLSQQAVDVLAVVAYNQPITRDDLETLINDSRPTQRVLNLLIRRDLLAREKSPTASTQFVYRTTERFLDLFELRDLGDLPRTEDPQ